MSTGNRGGSFLQRYVPRHFNNPIGLAIRLVRTGDHAALYAMWTAVLGLFLTPFDVLLGAKERRLRREASDPELPILLVCGPSRSGTTLTEQILIATIQPAYLNNLTSLFPRSPIIANRIFARLVHGTTGEFRSYYGKSVGLAGANDALYLWDRWLGAEHRSHVPTSAAGPDLEDMRRFFGALQQERGIPVVNKNNHLNCCAHLVAPALLRAHFICMQRQREHLAQSLILARRDIHGDLSVPYGIGSPVQSPAPDPVEDVCRQVLYHERMARWQQEQLGRDRFWIVQYEDLCRDPHAFVNRVWTELLGRVGEAPDLESLTPFEPSTRIRVTSEEYERILRTFEALEGREEEYWAAPPAAGPARSQFAEGAPNEH